MPKPTYLFWWLLRGHSKPPARSSLQVSLDLGWEDRRGGKPFQGRPGKMKVHCLTRQPVTMDPGSR